MQEVLGAHEYVREVPSDEADGLTIQKFKEDCEIHLAENSCMMYGFLTGVMQLDTRKKFEFKADAEGNAPPQKCWSLRDLLKKVIHKGKPLFRAITSLKEGTVMAIVCTGKGRDEALTNIVLLTAAWSMYNLLLEHNATGESIEEAFAAWFSCTHTTAAVEYSEYDQETGNVRLL